MSQFQINSITNNEGNFGPVIAGVTTNNSTGCMIIPAGPTEHRGGRGRLVFVGGYYPSPHANIGTLDFVDIATIGNATDFGDLTIDRRCGNGVSSSRTRGLFYSGSPGPGPHRNTIDYITIQTKGNAIDFGDITTHGNQDGASHGSNLTRSVNHAPTDGNTIEYLTIATLGNTQDFGDATHASDSKGGIDNSNGSIE